MCFASKQWNYICILEIINKTWQDRQTWAKPGPSQQDPLCRESFPIAAFSTKPRKWKRTPATLHAVMQMFSHLRAVEDLEPLPLPEAEVILCPGFIVIKSHKQSHPCRKTKSWASELWRMWMKNQDGTLTAVSLLWLLGCRWRYSIMNFWPLLRLLSSSFEVLYSIEWV